MSLQGVQGEERDHYTREESRRIRRRSLVLLGSLVAPLKRRIAQAVVLILIATVAQVAGPSLIAYGINQGVRALDGGDAMPIAGTVALFLVAAVTGAVLTAWYVRVAARISQAIMLELRTRMFRHTQQLSLEFHESYTSGRIISRQTSDLDAIRELLDSGLNQLTTGLLYMGFTGAALVLLDPLSGLMLVCSLIPLAILTRWFQVRSQRLFRKSRVISARLIVRFVETMTGIRAVKAFRAEERNRVRYGENVEDYRDINLRSIQLFGVYEPVLVLIGNVTMATVLVVGALRTLEPGGLTVGVLLGAVLYVRNFFGPMHDMAMFYNAYQGAAAALEKISGVLEERPSVPEPANPHPLPAARGQLVFDRVRFAYREDRVILPEFDLRIPAGQTLALVGTTGAGKSTLAKLVARFYDPNDGALTLDDVDLRELSSADLRRAIVMVTQEAYLFSGSVAQNIELGKPTASREEVIAAARAVGAHDFITSLPDGYDTDVSKRGGRVSAGQRQLISFARAFLANPAVLILDEATAQLDIPSERLVQQGLQTLLADRTAIIIAHRLSTVAIADRVLVMEHGRIVEDGSSEELTAGTGRFAKLHAAWRDSLV